MLKYKRGYKVYDGKIELQDEQWIEKIEKRVKSDKAKN